VWTRARATSPARDVETLGSFHIDSVSTSHDSWKRD
jgi:hypothetical protein